MTTLSPARSWFLVAVATATMAVSYFDRQAVAVLGPTISAALDLTETEYGYVGAAFALAYLVGAPIAGRLVDRHGARVVLPIAVVAWTAVSGLHALVPGLLALLALRVALGLTEAPSFPSAAQTIGRALPPERREAGFGILFTGSSVGGALAAALLPRFNLQFGWRGAMVASAVLGLLWLPAWWLATRGDDAREALAPPKTTTPPGDLGMLVRHPAVQRAVLGVLGSAPIFGFAHQWGAKILVAQHAVAQESVGTYLWLPPLLFDLGAVGFGAMAAARTRRTGSDAPHRALFACGVALLVVLAGLRWSTDPWTTTWLLGIAIAGNGAVYTLGTGDMLNRVPASQVAAAGSLTAAAQSVAHVVGMPIIGRVLDRTHDYGLVATGLVVWALPFLAIWLIWDPRRR